MDNASIHKSPKIREAIEKAECSLVYQPSYSPDLNPIEYLRARLSKNLTAYLMPYNLHWQNEIRISNISNSDEYSTRVSWISEKVD